MKKWMLILLLVCCMALALTTTALAADTYTIGDFTYMLQNGVLWLTGYKGVEAEVNIPATAEIDGQEWMLQEIANEVFMGNTHIKSVTIPENVQHLGDRVFCNCTSLQTVTLSSTVNRIGVSLFKNCAMLTQVTINGTLESCSEYSLNSGNYSDSSINNSVFYNAGTNSDSLTVTFGPKAKRVPAYLFATGYGRSANVYPHLTAVYLPEGLEEIGEYAFYNCYTFSGPELNEGLLSIGRCAFMNCTGLKSITLPSSIKKLERGAFKNCTNLSTLTINGNLDNCSSYSTNSGNYSDSSVNNSVFYNTGTNVNSFTVTFGPEVTRIPSYLFATGYARDDNCYAHITSVKLSDSVRQIGAYAFGRCYKLESVEVGEGLESIGEGAFARCTALPGIELNEGLKTISSYAFDNCSGLKSITLPSTVTTLKECAFRYCTGLAAVTINGNLDNCSSDSVNSGNFSDGCINNSVFYDAGTQGKAFTVTFGPKVTRIPAYLFATGEARSDNVYAHITAVVLPDTVRRIGDYAFYRCYDLQSVTLGAGLESIGEGAFARCTALAGIELNEGLDYIENYAFDNCTALKSITIPSSVTRLYDGAFRNCTGLSAVTFNGDLEDCTSSSTTSFYTDDYSVFYNTGTNVDSFTVTFGPHVTRIPAYLFATGKAKTDKVYAHITAVFIPDTVEEIGEGAFYSCYDLASLLYGGSEQRWTWVKENGVGKNNGYLTGAAAVYNYALPAPIPRELEIMRITVHDGGGEIVDAVPLGDFLATVTVKNLSSKGDTTVLLAAYNARGQMRGVVYASIRSFPPHALFDVTIPIENPDGDIAYLKAFTIAGLDNPIPISGALRFG